MKIIIPEKYQKYQIFIWLAFSAIVTGATLFLIIIPQIAKVIELNKFISESQQRIDGLNKKANFLQQLDTTAYKDNINNTLITLPDEKAYPGAINQVEVLVSQAGLRIAALSVSGLGKSKEGFDTYQLNVNVVGDSNSVNNLIDSLKKGPRVMTIGSIDVTSSQLGIYQILLQISTYFQPQQTHLGSIDQPIVDLTAEEVIVLTKFNEVIKSIPNTIVRPDPSAPKGKVNPFL